MDRLFVSIFTSILPVLKIQDLVEIMLKYNKFFLCKVYAQFQCIFVGGEGGEGGFQNCVSGFPKKSQQEYIMMMMIMMDDDDDDRDDGLDPREPISPNLLSTCSKCTAITSRKIEQFH